MGRTNVEGGVAMERREFLAGLAAAGAAVLPGRSSSRQTAARDKRSAALARIALMTLNFTNLLKTPWQPPSPERTLDLFDLPDMYADVYGVHNIELQHYHLASTEPSYFQTLRSRIDRARSQATQLVVEFGGLNISAPDHNFLPRLQAIDLTKVWIDRCAVLACPRIMVNQGQPTQENKSYAIETLKAMADYGRSKGVKVTMETRGSGGAVRGAAPPTGGAAQVTPPSEPAWLLLNEIARAAGAYINIDMGGVAAANQEELNTALRSLLPTTSGSMHTRQSANWDLAAAIRLLEAAGYTGVYSIEARGHEGTRPVYDTILATL
jgi:hypothetical protein